jgi:Fe-coproporphyrin III synthase
MKSLSFDKEADCNTLLDDVVCINILKYKRGKIMKKLNGTVIVTYRCNARCTMCNRYKSPSNKEEEISLDTIRKLPQMYFTNITGGEPFIRTDLKDIVRELYKKSERIVISTNGFFTERIIELCREFPNVGIRISIEGLEQTNNTIRGLDDGFNRGYTTLKKLVEMGMKDVGFGMTVQDANAKDLLALYHISDEMNMEFATASLHNSFYFVEAKNIIYDRLMVGQQFEDLINKLLNSNSPKKWFRAYFNHGLINYIFGQKRLLPCNMAFDTFFIDPYGDVMPCNGTKDKEVMGNLNSMTWDELWNSAQAGVVRQKVRCCNRQCWMIGSVSPAMQKYIWIPGLWVLKHKFQRFFKAKKYSMYENKIVRDYRDGKVTKEELDACSTCDMEAVINDGLSVVSRESLKGKSGEEIVDADISAQMTKE